MDYAFVSTAITRRRPLSRHRRDSEATPSPSTSRRTLKRTLNLVDLIFYGVGCSVGAGIYSLVGIGADLAGPSIALSFFLCGITCCFTSLAYAEFAARVPLAGSAYTFTYVSFGELCGWLVGWNLTLGYAVSAAVVARSWAEYLVGFCEGIVAPEHIPSLVWLTHAPVPLLGENYECCPLAMVIIGVCTLVLVTGAKESTRFNTAMTILNLTVLGFVLVAGLGSGTVHLDNLTPVFPHGVSGMARGAGLVFFAYLGFDMVSCLSEEVKNPERNMPIGIIGSLLASMSIYVAVSVVVVGMVPVSLLGEDVPIINALLANSCCTHEDQVSLADADKLCLTYNCTPVIHPVLYVGSRLVSFGAIFGLTTATFACLMGQPRIFYSMAQDGLLFKIYARVHPKTGVPTIGTILTGICTAVIACMIDLESLANAISLGTLQVFTFVNAGVIILRTRQPSDDGEDDDSSASAEASPLVLDTEAAAAARSIGLVQKSSRQIRDSIRASISSSTSKPVRVQDNGSKPHWFTLLFTIGSVLASAGISREWHRGIVVVCIIMSATCAFLLSRLPRSTPPDTFTCPMVPFVPLMGILCNSYMMGSMPVGLSVSFFGSHYDLAHYDTMRTRSHILLSLCTLSTVVLYLDCYSPVVAGRFDVLLWLWNSPFGAANHQISTRE
jgi:APA family basic amino acid/polyamine antiporter